MFEKIAIIADIHANLQAFEAVLEDCLKQNVDNYWFLGDYVDYGGNPVEVVKLLNAFPPEKITAIGGNHDAALFGLTPIADGGDCKFAYEYTKKLYNQNYKDFEWLERYAGTKIAYALDWKAVLVHGTLDDPYWGRSYSGYLDNAFDVMKQDGFEILACGHSHERFWVSRDGMNIINPGSVGQPRNGIPKAQYAILEEGNIPALRCVEYDICAAANAIKKAGLPASFAERLFYGR